MTAYECDVCKATFEGDACPACGEFVEPRVVEYRDGSGTFTIGGEVSEVSGDV
jgi:rRNA maturation endonuclease Nob1